MEELPKVTEHSFNQLNWQMMCLIAGLFGMSLVVQFGLNKIAEAIEKKK